MAALNLLKRNLATDAITSSFGDCNALLEAVSIHV